MSVGKPIGLHPWWLDQGMNNIGVEKEGKRVGVD
jgi:hypothetical protein